MKKVFFYFSKAKKKPKCFSVCSWRIFFSLVGQGGFNFYKIQNDAHFFFVV